MHSGRVGLISRPGQLFYKVASTIRTPIVHDEYIETGLKRQNSTDNTRDILRLVERGYDNECGQSVGVGDIATQECERMFNQLIG